MILWLKEESIGLIGTVRANNLPKPLKEKFALFKKVKVKATQVYSNVISLFELP